MSTFLRVYRTKEIQLHSLCRCATWALSNISKNTAVLAAPFLSPLDQDGGALFAKFLLLHEQFYSPLSITSTPNPNPHTSKMNVEWLEVILEISSLLAFLTSKEDQAVELLMSNSSANDLVSVLAYRVASSYPCNSSLFSNICTFSLLTIGNIATACDGLRTIVYHE